MSASGAEGFSNEELLALLRDERVTPGSIIAEMEDAGAAPHSPETLAATRVLLNDLSAPRAAAIEALPAPLRALVFEAAIARQSVELLSALLQSQDKAVVKEAKRAIHILKTRGLKVEAPRRPAPTPAPAAEQAPVLMTSADSVGDRLLFFAEQARGGIDVAQLVISDDNGVVSAELAPISRKEYRRLVEHFESSTHTVAAGVPRSYARGLVARALDMNARARRPVPSGYNEVAFLIGPAVAPEASPGRRLARPENEAALLALGADLLDVQGFRSWMPPEADVLALQREMEKIATSQLYIDERQRAAAVGELVASSVAAFWTRGQRDRYAERMFDSAWLLRGRKREAESDLTIATAWALDGDRAIEAIPFARALFGRFVPKPERAAPRTEALRPSEGLILPG